MKKLLAAICSLAVLACGALAFAGCGDTIGIPDEEGYTIKIGYTEYAPMNYYEGGKFVGYDTEFASSCARTSAITMNSSSSTTGRQRWWTWKRAPSTSSGTA